MISYHVTLDFLVKLKGQLSSHMKDQGLTLVPAIYSDLDDCGLCYGNFDYGVGDFRTDF